MHYTLDKEQKLNQGKKNDSCRRNLEVGYLVDNIDVLTDTFHITKYLGKVKKCKAAAVSSPPDLWPVFCPEDTVTPFQDFLLHAIFCIINTESKQTNKQISTDPHLKAKNYLTVFHGLQKSVKGSLIQVLILCQTKS